jgi:hypothetical protein
MPVHCPPEEETREMDRERAETHLRLLAETELRRAMKMPVSSIPAGSRHRLDRDIRNRAIGSGPGHPTAQLAVTITPRTDSGSPASRADS